MIGKFIGYIIGAYFIYYLGNIIYDLFLAKEKPSKEDNQGELISLGDMVTDHSNIENVSVEDVENVAMPESYDIDENILYPEESNEKDYETSIQKNYEEEETIDLYEKQLSETKEKDLEKSTSYFEQLINKCSNNVISEKKELIKNVEITAEKWESFINQATTKVVLTSNNNGQKVYKSTM